MPTKTRPIFKNLYDKIVFESEERGEVRGKEIGKEIGKLVKKSVKKSVKKNNYCKTVFLLSGMDCNKDST
ncbi:MAG: hypothetical protein OT643_12010 [Bacteroidetes bacterium]|nr:hypothetical protein [Bacteroidota bacterium]